MEKGFLRLTRPSGRVGDHSTLADFKRVLSIKKLERLKETPFTCAVSLIKDFQLSSVVKECSPTMGCSWMTESCCLTMGSSLVRFPDPGSKHKRDVDSKLQLYKIVLYSFQWLVLSFRVS